MIAAGNKRIFITLTEKEIEDLQRAADQDGLNKSTIIKLTLKDYMKKRRFMKTLYQYLVENAGYEEEEAAEIIDYWSCGFTLKDEVYEDIKKYAQEYIEHFNKI